ncbi:dTDP-4-dehydrorhamnose reductase [Chromohalobacter sp.]|uniref:dTDP-4-dehydrorhamnose reductase n=1 Tax=Chromohalobacter sp. TaxID=50740 RepID=UPI001D33309D|nr:dTDP-4-dehydrorhamnose reductase [Chromohalobacter sp.]NQY44351.1 dTDP-4-dehydrorhamnose reductase [Chromohalobacter sp.]
MNIFITGSNGQVGFELERQFSFFGNVIAPTRQELDLSSAQAVESFLSFNNPALILNAAAYTAVDKAEEDPRLARRLNSELPSQLAEYAASNNAILVHYSSDYVYPGNGTAPWTEHSPARPLSVYGHTKLEGDQSILESSSKHLIFRTSWVYSARGNNFMKTMLRLGQERDTLKVVNDQIGVPTPARLLAQVTQLAIERRVPFGLYHLAPRGETSWHGFATEIFRLAIGDGVPLTIHPNKVIGIPTADYPTLAERPLNSRMSLNKLEKALGVFLPDWRSQLKLTLEEAIAK